MNFLLFLAIFLHLVSGLLFCALPLIAALEFAKVQCIGRLVARESLLHSIGFGAASLFIGALMAGAQWNSSFDTAWAILGHRWIYLMIEFLFSIVLILVVLQLTNKIPTRRARWISVFLLFIAATNSLYHFPSLMVLTRELRRHPDLYHEGLSMASLIFSAPIFAKWIHIAIASVLISAVWHRLISAWFFHEKSKQLHKLAIEQHTDEETTILANEDIVELRAIDWRGGLWAMFAIVFLWFTGLAMFLVLPSIQVTQLTSITSGKSNQLMIGIVLATFVGVRCIANSTAPNRIMRVLDVCLLLVTIASMIDSVSRI